MKELIVEAKTDNLGEVLAFLDEQLEAHGCPIKTQMQIDIAVEELFVNIARYAYGPAGGTAAIRIDVSGDPPEAAVTFVDRGIPYDPLAKEDPDVTLSAEEREIGGLGIFMVKKSMDDIRYTYDNGQNILTIKKKIG